MNTKKTKAMTNNKQQTAVEWLIKEHFGGIENCTPDFRVKIEKAKEMEKGQRQHTFEQSRLNNKFVGLKYESFEDYYNETYGNEQQ